MVPQGHDMSTEVLSLGYDESGPPGIELIGVALVLR